MAVRWRKYFKECKPIKCCGRKGKYCPSELPHRVNGEYKTCGVWCVEFFDSNRQWQSLTYPDVRNRTDAKERLSLLITDRERGMLNLPGQRKIPTLAEYSKRYLEIYSHAKENTKSAKQRSVKTLTIYLGDYRLDKITSFVIEKFRIERKEKDKVKDGTINDDVTILSHILNRATKEDIINKNPCKDIKKLKIVQARDRILTTEETSLLLTKLQGKDRMAILLGLFCGLRLNETLKLTWADFDFAKSLLTFTPSKTGKLVTVPLSDYIIGELNNYKNLESATNSHLFERDVSRLVVLRYCKHFSKLFKQLGIHGFTYHCLRHSFVSLQSDLGTGTATIQSLVGHASSAMVSRYTHTGLESKRRAIEVLTNHVLNGCKESALPLALQA